jgi:hypothetical protein
MRRRGRIIPLPGRRWPSRTPDDEHGLIEVHRCEQAEALVMKSLFESEGIPTVLRSNLIASLHPFSVGDQGQVAVLVPASQLARCRPLMIRVARRPPPR